MKKVIALLVVLGLTSVFAAEANATKAEKNTTKAKKAKAEKNTSKKVEKNTSK